MSEYILSEYGAGMMRDATEFRSGQCQTTQRRFRNGEGRGQKREKDKKEMGLNASKGLKEAGNWPICKSVVASSSASAAEGRKRCCEKKSRRNEADDGAGSLMSKTKPKPECGQRWGKWGGLGDWGTGG